MPAMRQTQMIQEIESKHIKHHVTDQLSQRSHLNIRLAPESVVKNATFKIMTMTWIL